MPARETVSHGASAGFCSATDEVMPVPSLEVASQLRAAGAALAAGRETLRIEQARALEQTFVTGLHGAFVVCAVISALGVVTALLRGAEGGDPPSVPSARRDEVSDAPDDSLE
jgi:hypothetical protein